MIGFSLSRFLLPEFGIEACARLAGWVADVCLPRQNPYSVERRLRGLLYASRFRARGLRLDRRLQLEGSRFISLGNNVTLYGGSHFVASPNHPIVIGDNTHVGRNAFLAGMGGIEIGANCAIAAHVNIHSLTNHYRFSPNEPILKNPALSAKVTIGDDVSIGAGAIILPGVTIGSHAFIGAGAVVTRDVPPWHVAVGVPARIVKDRREQSPIDPSRAALVS